MNVSIITPAYKAVRFVDSAWESVRNQTHTDWEWIVVDDGPDSELQERLQHLNDPRIRIIIHAENQGQCAARNHAHEQAKGDCLAYLDIDDRWPPEHLESLLDHLAGTEPQIQFVGSAQFEDGTDKPLGFWEPSADEMKRFPASLCYRNFINPSGVLITVSAMRATGDWETHDQASRAKFRSVYAEDLDYWLRAAQAGVRFTFVESHRFGYRKNSGSMTSSEIRIFEGQAFTLLKHGRANPALRSSCLRNASSYFLKAARCRSANTAVRSIQNFVRALLCRVGLAP